MEVINTIMFVMLFYYLNKVKQHKKEKLLKRYISIDLDRKIFFMKNVHWKVIPIIIIYSFKYRYNIVVHIPKITLKTENKQKHLAG